MFRNKRIINGKEYNYLEHSYRLGNKVNKISLYLPKHKIISFDKFLKINGKNIDEMTKKKVNYIKNHLEVNSFYDYGNQLEYIEKSKFLFQIFFKKLSVKEQENIIEEYLRNFIINSMEMEGGTISYELAKAIDENKKVKINYENVNEQDIPLYKQLKEAYFKLKNIRLRSAKQIKEIHKIIYEGTYSFAGNFRKKSVTFGRSQDFAKTVSPTNIKKGIKKIFENYSKSKNKVYDFDRVILFHRDYQEVHPFRDGNSRLGRLIMLQQFTSLYYPPLIIRGSSSTKYRTSLVKGINDNRTTSLTKLFYQSYKRTFEKFWKPAIEKAIKQELEKISIKEL